MSIIQLSQMCLPLSSLVYKKLGFANKTLDLLNVRNNWSLVDATMTLCYRKCKRKNKTQSIRAAQRWTFLWQSYLLVIWKNIDNKGKLVCHKFLFISLGNNGKFVHFYSPSPSHLKNVFSDRTKDNNETGLSTTWSYVEVFIADNELFQAYIVS